MMSRWQEQSMRGVYLLEPFCQSDDRGLFVKTFHAPQAAEVGLTINLREEFYSISHKNVLRGMHFQLPPHQHQKIVYCISGRITDVLLDLRNDEPTYGKALSFELSAANKLVVWIPPGIAHGFLSHDDATCVVYKTDNEYAPQHDAGLLWNSFGFEWQCEAPVLSSRDSGFPSLINFNSPF